MIDLKDYRKYWEGVANRIPMITSCMGVTVDDDMGPRLQDIPMETATLFWIVPNAQTRKGAGIDDYQEDNTCVIFVMTKYDRQRRSAVEALELVQPVMECIKGLLIEDMAGGCPTLAGLDVGTLSTIPETGFYNDFAGWSLGFTLKSE